MAESRLITVLFTDLVGSTELSGRIGDAAADELRRRHLESLRAVIAETGGDKVKTIGDAMMVTYRGAADAIAGAVRVGISAAPRPAVEQGHVGGDVDVQAPPADHLAHGVGRHLHRDRPARGAS